MPKFWAFFAQKKFADLGAATLFARKICLKIVSLLHKFWAFCPNNFFLGGLPPPPPWLVRLCELRFDGVEIEGRRSSSLFVAKRGANHLKSFFKVVINFGLVIRLVVSFPVVRKFLVIQACSWLIFCPQRASWRWCPGTNRWY